MTDGRPPELGLAPLTARSLILTALLGSHPPRLPVRALVSLGALFDVAEGTVRTALSRMSVAGEVHAEAGSYVLGERMRRRQTAQDEAVRGPQEPWDGTWWLTIVDAPARSAAQRRAFRSWSVEQRMGELRPGVWLRPANVPRPPVLLGALCSRGPLEGRSDDVVARQLWDLEALAATSLRLAELAERALDVLEPGDPLRLKDTFLVSVAAVRFLREEPQLPRAIVGDDTSVSRLRAAQDRLADAHRELVRAFLHGSSADEGSAGDVGLSRGRNAATAGSGPAEEIAR